MMKHSNDSDQFVEDELPWVDKVYSRHNLDWLDALKIEYQSKLEGDEIENNESP